MKNNDRVNDKSYWENYYSKQKHPFEPTLFAQYVSAKFLKPGQTLVELGCGNGRDAVYFAKQGIHVVAIDQCGHEIQFLSQNYSLEHVKFMEGDFTTLDDELTFNHVYSRFTLHSVSRSQQDQVVSWISKSLEAGGYFFLEVRGKQNELYGKGERVTGELDAFIHDGHYRRFVDLEETLTNLRSTGLEVIKSAEDKGFSPFAGVDETFVRIIVRKTDR